MFEAYKIGVTVALHNAAGRGLRSISREMQEAHRETLALQRDVKSLERITGPDGIYARRAKASLATARAAQTQADALSLAQRAKTEQQIRTQQQLERAEREYAARRTERVNRLSEIGSTRQLLLDRQTASEQDAFRQFAALRQKAEDLDVSTERKLADRQARMVQLRRRGAILEEGIEISREQTRQRLASLAERRRFYEERIAWRQGKGRGTSFLEARLAQINRDAALIERKASLTEKRHAKSWEKNQRDLTTTSDEIDALPRKREIEAAKIRAEQEAVHNRHLLASEALTKRVRGLDSEAAKITTKVQNAEAAHLENVGNLRAKAVRLAEEEAGLGARLAASAERRRAAEERAADFERRRAEAKERHEKRQADLAKKRAEHERVQQRHATIAGLQTAGIGLMAAGGGLAWLLSKTYGPAKDLQNARSELQSAGIGPGWRSRVEHQAIKLGHRIPTSDTASSMRAFLDLRQVLGDERMALDALPNMLRASAILGAIGGRTVSVGQLSEEMAASMGRAIDMRGKALNPETFFKEANEMARVMVWSGGKITPTTYQGSFKYMRGAKYTPTEEFMYKYFPSWIASTKSAGGGAGAHGGASVGFASLTKAILQGQGMTKDRVALAMEIGAIDPKDVTAKGKLKPGKGWKFTDVGAKEEFAFGNNPFFYLRDFLHPLIVKHLKKQGLEATDANITALSNRLAPTGPSADVLGYGLQSIEEIQRDAKMIGRAKDISAYRTLLRTNPKLAEEALSATVRSFQQEVGDSLIPFVLEYLPKLTQKIRGLTQWMDDNPETTRSLVKMTAYTSGLAMVGGAISLTTSGILGLAKPFRLVAGLFTRNGEKASLAARGLAKTRSGLSRLAHVLGKASWANLAVIAGNLSIIAGFLGLPLISAWANKKSLDDAEKRGTLPQMIPVVASGGSPFMSTMGISPMGLAAAFGSAPSADFRSDKSTQLPESVLATPRNGGGDLYISLELDGRPISNYVMRDFEDRVDRQATSATRFDGRRNRTVQGAGNRR